MITEKKIQIASSDTGSVWVKKTVISDGKPIFCIVILRNLHPGYFTSCIHRVGPEVWEKFQDGLEE